MQKIFILLTLICLASCSHEVRTHGHFVDPDNIALLKEGKATKTQVRALLGSPSNIDFFEDESWFYIAQKNQTRVFEKDAILERNALRLSFNQSGTLITIETLDLTHTKEIDPLERTTPSTGKPPSFLQQMVGNFGRFREQQDKRHKDKTKG